MCFYGDQKSLRSAEKGMLSEETLLLQLRCLMPQDPSTSQTCHGYTRTHQNLIKQYDISTHFRLNHSPCRSQEQRLNSTQLNSTNLQTTAPCKPGRPHTRLDLHLSSSCLLPRLHIICTGVYLGQPAQGRQNLLPSSSSSSRLSFIPAFHSSCSCKASLSTLFV